MSPCSVSLQLLRTAETWGRETTDHRVVQASNAQPASLQKETCSSQLHQYDHPRRCDRELRIADSAPGYIRCDCMAVEAPEAINETADCGGSVAGLWQSCGGTVSSLWRDCGEAVASLWRLARLWRGCGDWRGCGETAAPHPAVGESEAGQRRRSRPRAEAAADGRSSE